jgi:hypothetical protein
LSVRRAALILLAACGLAAAPAPTPTPLAAPGPPAGPPPLPPRPDPFLAPSIAYVRVGEVEDGRWQYVNVPAGRSLEPVQTWRIDVFTRPVRAPHGEGAYSVSLYIYDCRARLFRLDHSELFDATRTAIERFDGPEGFQRPVGNSDEDIRQACGQLNYEGPRLVGLDAVLGDAKAALETG